MKLLAAARSLQSKRKAEQHRLLVFWSTGSVLSKAGADNQLQLIQVIIDTQIKQ